MRVGTAGSAAERDVPVTLTHATSSALLVQLPPGCGPRVPTIHALTLLDILANMGWESPFLLSLLRYIVGL